MKNLLSKCTAAAALSLPASLVQAHEAGSAHSHSGEALLLAFIVLAVCGGLTVLHLRR